jgi:hypothetical protein
MSTAAQSVLQQVLALPVEDQQEIARALNHPAALGALRLEDVLGKYLPLSPESDVNPDDHNELFVQAIESSKGIKHGSKSVR